MPYVITDGCIDVTDRSCVEECPVDCIYEGNRKLYIQPSECIDCGACEPVCPQEAISLDRKTPSDKAAFIQDNRRFFSEPLPGHDTPLGTPGGSENVGPVGVDTALVRDWPVAG
jgi:NAD-dependent dihydropyrimidine dehydrogenase PreA subunit